MLNPHVIEGKNSSQQNLGQQRPGGRLKAFKDGAAVPSTGPGRRDILSCHCLHHHPALLAGHPATPSPAPGKPLCSCRKTGSGAGRQGPWRRQGPSSDPAAEGQGRKCQRGAVLHCPSSLLFVPCPAPLAEGEAVEPRDQGRCRQRRLSGPTAALHLAHRAQPGSPQPSSWSLHRGSCLQQTRGVHAACKPHTVHVPCHCQRAHR